MNSTFFRILAALMIMAAIATAWFGYKLNNKKPVDSIKVVLPTYPQIVAHQDIPVGHVLTADDLEITTAQQQDSQSFSNTQSLIGKVTTTAVIKGEKFKTSHFPNSSSLAQVLAPHERAVAIKINEVIGVGGFIKPGDHVDVLFYLRANQENGELSSAQVVLQNVRVLAYGDLLNVAEPSQENTSTKTSPYKLGTSSDIKKDKDSRSAILAVPEQEVSKLMLADSSGVLRLALRGALPSASLSLARDNMIIHLADVSQPLSMTPLDQDKSSDASSKQVVKNKPKVPTSKKVRVIVHRGEKVEVINVSK